MASTEERPGCLASILNLLGLQFIGSESKRKDHFPFRTRDDFLSPAEVSFYQVIKNMMGDHFVICPKVSLADIFFVIKPNENYGAHNRINRKHVDFLICDPKTMKPVFAIELDDKSHDRDDRSKRDVFVNNVFLAANLPLVHVPVRQSYNTNDLGTLFKQALQQNKPASENAGNSIASPKNAAPKIGEVIKQSPLCPKCGVPMVLRTASKGDQAGKKFFGCPNYPKCRVILASEE